MIKAELNEQKTAKVRLDNKARSGSFKIPVKQTNYWQD